MAKQGYSRSAKKCKEKFENVSKYHKRTKDARSGRQDSKSYRFFSQLEALNIPSSSTPALPPQLIISVNTPSTTALLENIALPTINTSPTAQNNATGMSYSGTESEEEGLEAGTRKRNPELGPREDASKMMGVFQGFIKQVMDGQEAMLHKCFEEMERLEKNRVLRDEAWRRQETSRLTRAHEFAAQQRAAAVSRTDAIISLIQNLTSQKIPFPPPPPHVPIDEMPTSTPMPKPEHQHFPSRWPKEEVYALIELRAEMEDRYQEAGLKALFWEDISLGMRQRGYNRRAKRCKEKWENINKYFKKVKESKKIRPEDAKTCPYFHKLDVLYKNKFLQLRSTGCDTSIHQLENRANFP